MDRKDVFLSCAFLLILFAAPEARAQSGTISANPNPCTIYLIQDLCTVTVSWSSQGTTLVEVWVASSVGEQKFARTGSGGPYSADAPWIGDQQAVFNLYDYTGDVRGAKLASVTVRGERVLRCEPQ